MLAELSDLLAWRGSALRGIDWRGVRQSLAGGSGSHGASLPVVVGRGLQFAESRPYQRGDDVRSIDWKVTARQGRPHTKVFRAERERPLWIVVDQGPTMQFGSRVSYKSVLAAHSAAWLAWSGSVGGDRVGGVTVGDFEIRICPPRAGANGVLALCEALCRPPTKPDAEKPPADLCAALSVVQAALRTGDRICVISDFYSLDSAASAGRIDAGLGALAERADLCLVHISDPLEVAPPPAGFYPLAGTPGAGWLDLSDPATREAWSAIFSRRRDALRALALRHGWPLLTLSTDGDLLQDLSPLVAGK